MKKKMIEGGLLGRKCGKRETDGVREEGGGRGFLKSRDRPRPFEMD